MVPTAFQSRIGDSTKRQLRKALLFISIAALFGLLSTSQLYSIFRFEGRDTPFWRVFIWQSSGWFIWSLLSPFVLKLGERFRIERQRLFISISIHIIASLCFTVFHLFLYTLIRWQFPLSPAEPLSLSSSFFFTVTSYFHFDILIYWAILGAGYAIDFYRKYQERELTAVQLKQQLAAAQLQTLRMQLHPHFLFNTLHTIAVLVRKQENQVAIRMISGLSDLLRYALKETKAQEVTLQQELDFIRHYLEIEQIRFQDRLHLRFTVEPETMEARVPNLILQPLVENAIRHGIGASATAGLIEVTAKRENGNLLMQVQDDGSGLCESWQQENHAGIGLTNTRERLSQHYGAEYAFDIKNASPNGVIASIQIPYRTASAFDDNE
jgi:two-component sensor histidine kinase